MSLEGGNRRPSVSRVKGRRRGLADRVAVGRGGADVREFASFAGMGGWLRLQKRGIECAAARCLCAVLPYIRAVCCVRARRRGVCCAQINTTLSPG